MGSSRWVFIRGVYKCGFSEEPAVGICGSGKKVLNFVTRLLLLSRLLRLFRNGQILVKGVYTMHVHIRK